VPQGYSSGVAPERGSAGYVGAMIRVALAVALVGCKSAPPKAAPAPAALRPYAVLAVDGLDHFQPWSLTVDGGRILMAGFGPACTSSGTPNGGMIAVRSIQAPALHTIRCAPGDAYFAIAPFAPHTLAIGGRGPNGALVRVIDEESGAELKTIFEGGDLHNSIVYELASRTIADGTRKLAVTGRLGGADRELFVARYSEDGARDWIVGLKPDRTPIATHVALERDGGVIFSGDFSGEVKLGAKRLRSIASEEAFVARIDPLGNVAWTREAKGASSVRAMSVRDGLIALGGNFSARVSFGGPTALEDSGAFVYVVASDGTPRWLRSGSEDGSVIGTAIADDRSVDVAVLGLAGLFVRRFDKTGAPSSTEWSATMSDVELAFMTRSDAGQVIAVGSHDFNGFVARLGAPR
jgi:hypothetical protein